MGLPTSLEAAHGHIRYVVKVVLERPIWLDKEFSEMFTVIKPLNLNLYPDLKVFLLVYRHNCLHSKSLIRIFSCPLLKK